MPFENPNPEYQPPAQTEQMSPVAAAQMMAPPQQGSGDNVAGALAPAPVVSGGGSGSGSGSSSLGSGSSSLSGGGSGGSGSSGITGITNPGDYSGDSANNPNPNGNILGTDNPGDTGSGDGN